MAMLMKQVEGFVKVAEGERPREEIAKRFKKFAQEFLGFKVSAPVRNRTTEISSQNGGSAPVLFSDP